MSKKCYIPYTKEDVVKTSFHISNKIHNLYIVEDNDGNAIARISILTRYNQSLNDIELYYRLWWTITGEQRPINEKRYIRNLFKNIVNILTFDIQTVYTDDINSRIDYPFFKENYKLVIEKGVRYGKGD